MIGLTPILILETRLPLTVALILTFSAHLMVVDDWWMSFTLFRKYPPQSAFVVYYDLFFLGCFVSLYIILIEAGRGVLPLSGYLVMLSFMSLLDVGWCYNVIRQHGQMKQVNKADYVQLVTWMIMGPVAAVLFFFGFVFLYMGGLSQELTALAIIGMYLFRRGLDLLAPRLYIAIART